VTAVANADPSIHTELPGRRATLVLESSELGNLLYELDCMASASNARCSEDERVLGEWRTLRARYADAGVADSAPTGQPLRFPDDPRGEVSYAQKIAIASYAARDLAGYRESLSLLLAPKDVAKAMAVVAHFRPRFHRYWGERGSIDARAFVSRLSQLVKTEKLGDFVDRMATFYGAALPHDAKLRFHFMLRPRGDGDSHGTQMEDHAIVEFVAGEEPRTRVDVVLHELAHYLYGLRTLDLRPAFIRDPGEDSLALYGIFNEAIATALGQGAVGRRVLAQAPFEKELQTPGSFYNDPAIDGAGKAMTPLVEAMIANGQSIDEGFLGRYLDVVRRALGPLSKSPALRLRTMGIAYEPELEAAAVELRTSVRAGSASTWNAADAPAALDYFKTYPDASGVILLRETQLGKLAPWDARLGSGTRAAIVAAARRQHSLVWAVSTSPKATLFVFVVADAAQLKPLVDAFLIAAPFSGLGPFGAKLISH
jgi:hypothetical protein